MYIIECMCNNILRMLCELENENENMRHSKMEDIKREFNLMMNFKAKM